MDSKYLRNPYVLKMPVTKGMPLAPLNRMRKTVPFNIAPKGLQSPLVKVVSMQSPPKNVWSIHAITGKKAWANALRQRAMSNEPIQHPMQGVARIFDAIMGARANTRAEKEYVRNQSLAAEYLANKQVTPAQKGWIRFNNPQAYQELAARERLKGAQDFQTEKENRIFEDRKALQQQGFDHANKMQQGRFGFQANENQRNRDFRSNENQLGRDFNKTLMQNRFQQEKDMQQAGFGQAEKVQQNRRDYGTERQQASWNQQEQMLEKQQDFVRDQNQQKQQNLDVDREGKIRKEFSSLPSVKAFSQVNDSHKRIVISATNPSPAGDLSLIFNYMKMLDPGSVVRESEFATAKGAASVPEQLKDRYLQVISGKMLTEDQRADFLSQANQLYKAQAGTYNQKVKTYRTLANEYGLSPDHIAKNRAQGQQPIPNGISPEDWNYMTSEEKATWTK